MKCKIKAFGISREIVGGGLVELDLPEGQTVSGLKNQLFGKYPQLAALQSVYIAVNSEYADENAMLKEGDEIALIPPVSGG
jgi:molybdopterin synthase sulfur carrier subunit